MHNRRGEYDTKVIPSSNFVRRMRLELTRSCDHYPLKVACIPISPPALCLRHMCKTTRARNRTRTCTSLNTRTWNERVYQFRHSGKTPLLEKKRRTTVLHLAWAENGTRTRDPDLGKVVLYQLSYFRILSGEPYHQHFGTTSPEKRLQRYNFFLIHQTFLYKKARKSLIKTEIKAF